MTIPALPQLDRTSPTFRTDLDTFFLTQLPNTVTELNSELTRIDGILPVGFVGTSTTSLTIAASGTIALTVQTNKGFAPGQFVVISRTADPVASQMGGTVTAYDYTTGAMSVTLSQSTGTGTYAAWTVAISTQSLSPYSVGDVAFTDRPLAAPSWLQANGGIYSQASYPALYAELGLLRNGVTGGTVSGITGLLQNVNTTVKPFVLANKIYFYATSGATTTAHYLYRTSDGATVDGGYPVTLPALGTAGQYSTSDAANWSAIVGNTIILAPSAGATGNDFVARSTDAGATWSKVTIAGIGTAGVYGIYAHGSTFVLVLSNSSTTYYTSTDGLTWTSRTLPANCARFVSANGVLVAMATASSASCYTSTDAISWSTRTLPSSHTWLAPAYNGASGVWLVNSSTNGGPYARSTDNCATWATVTGGTPVNSTVVSASGGGDSIKVFLGKFVVAYGALGAATFASLLHSSDGLVWSVAPIPALTGANVAIHVVGSEIYFWNSSSGTDCWVSHNLVDWSYQASDYLKPAAVRWALEANGVQAFFLAATTTHRRPVYAYNSITQFAVPNIPAKPGATAYIKA